MARKGNTTIVWEDNWGMGQLLLHDGSRCCLGFDAHYCGISDQDIKRHGYPTESEWRGHAWGKYPSMELKRRVAELTGDPISKGYTLEHMAGVINDNSDRSEAATKKALRLIFKAAGRRLVFRKGTAPWLREAS